MQSMWERVAVSARDGLGPALPHLALLHPHKHVDFMQLPLPWLDRSDLAIAVLAGFTLASLGLPANRTWPMLARPSEGLMVAATQLSHCRRRRFAPANAWMAVVAHILNFTASGTLELEGGPLLWTPSVTASFGRDVQLPPDAERQALVRGVQFYRNARLLPTAVGGVSTTHVCRACSEARNPLTLHGRGELVGR